ncbi:Lrp/AsnC family transcriptional regulator [Candidatus Woesearchaeota archaeon]|jgi:Lrp/AsnC family transcriptional regulator, leucine-responsive regulatory protein|nr:Lrp/AsnC family transcriptional regulator [Candidatus Woesearchaeota archaeon]
MNKKSFFNGVKESDMKILSELRKDSRQTLAEISRRTNISISTIYDRIKFHEKELIKKHTSIVNFELLGYSLRANILISTRNKQGLKEYLKEHPNINSAFEINGGYDFLVDCVFANMSECRDFLDSFDKFDVEKKQVHYIIDDFKVETFMTN